MSQRPGGVEHESQAGAAEPIACGVLVATSVDGPVTALQRAMDMLERFSAPTGPSGEQWLRQPE